MSGIAGIVHLMGSQSVPNPALRQMAWALAHRGPDEEGFHEEPGLGLAWRGLRLGGAPGRQGPLANEDGTVTAVCHGRFFNYQQLEQDLKARGHQLRTSCATELLVHLWEDHGEGMIDVLRGQFAFALWDRRRRRLMLGRDRLGVAPLSRARRGDWLLFGSEIKALLASGLVRAEVDRRGIDHLFTFLALPVARTCFLDVQALSPGHYLTVQAGGEESGLVRDHAYWDLDFPDRGHERDGEAQQLTDELQATLMQAVERRLRADTPVASYVSGGVDCTTVAALARQVRGAPIPSFTVRIESPHLDETERAQRAARAGGSEPIVVSCGPSQIVEAYPRLIQAAESPVLDTACAALLLLAERVHAEGYKVALTGDGADDLFAGYPWFRVDRLLRLFDWVPGVRPSQWIRRAALKWIAPDRTWAAVRRIESLVGGHHAWVDLYGLVSLSRSRFYSAEMQESLADHIAYEDLSLNLERMKHWHPLNQALYMGMKIQVPGLLLQAKGDRVAMRSAVELRCPFLDEDVVAFSASVHPRWKLRRLRDKYLLRQVAARWLPTDIARRPKTDFLAPFDSVYNEDAPPFVEELLSEASLRRAGYFDPAAVHLWRTQYRTLRRRSGKRVSVEIGLAGVVATQLWHHLFIDGGLADLPQAQVVPAAARQDALLV